MNRLAAKTSVTLDSIEILNFLAATDLFSGLGDVPIRRIAAELKTLRLPAQEVVIRADDSGDSLFLVYSGCLEVVVTRPNGTHAAPAELRPGSYFGETAFLAGDRRTATIRTVTDVILLEFPRAGFELLIEAHKPEFMPVVERLRRRIWLVRLSSTLYRSELFATLDSAVLKDLQTLLEPVALASGQTLFHQGEEGDALFILVSGRLRVTREDSQGKHVIGEVAPGETVGEIALLGGTKRTATISAARESILARLPAAGFERILCLHPAIAAPFFTRKMVALLSEKAGQPRSRKAVRTIAVFVADGTLDTDGFCRALTEALSATARVLRLTHKAVSRHLGTRPLSQTSPADPDYGKWIEWLNSKETEYDCILYEADYRDTPWSRLSIGQADEVLVVHDASGAPRVEEWEQALYQHGARERPVNLVLVHRGSGHPTGTAHWLETRRIVRHYHLQEGSSQDMGRLARSLTGRSVGLVLGGGCARSVAALGVIRAIEERGIPIDAIGGTSLGAIVAALYTLGYSPAEMLKIALRGGSVFRDWTLPILSIVSGRNMEKLSVFFGDTQIEDLWLPYFSVATNLTKGELKTFRHGPVFLALLASTRLPGVFPPIVFEGDLLIDGGVLNNVPADVMKEVCGGTVIAVDVSPREDLAGVPNYGRVVSGWRMLLDRWRSRETGPPVPNFLSVLSRCMTLNRTGSEQRTAQFADVYLSLPLDRFRFNDFESCPAMVEAAYRFAVKELERCWPEQEGSSRGVPRSAGMPNRKTFGESN